MINTLFINFMRINKKINSIHKYFFSHDVLNVFKKNVKREKLFTI